MSTRDLEQQIQQLLDGQLTEEEEQRLARRLREDEEALELYRQYAVVESSLNRLTQGKLALTESDEESIATIARKRSRFRSAEVTWIAAAAVLALTLVTLRLIFVKEEPLLILRAAPDTIYEVTHDTDEEEGTLAVGSVLRISQGTVELTFQSGVKSILQAPVHMTVHDENHLLLKEGTAWFRVPTEARGFRVDTPELEVTDLGTEFGVLATSTAGDEVHVFDGTVHVVSRNPLRHETTLSAGQARLSDPAGRLDSTAVRPARFLSTLPASLPHFYFSFDDVTAGRLAVDGSHPAARSTTAELVSTDLAGRLVPGLAGSCLALDGTTRIDTDWPGFAGRTPRSVALWLKVDPGMQPPPHLPALLGWGDPTNGINSKWKVHLSRQNEEQQLLPRVSFGVERYDSRTPVDDGRWHHLAVVYTGRTLDSGLPDVSIYLDGQKETLSRMVGPLGAKRSPREVRTLVSSDNAQPLRIGAGVVRADAQSFEGLIDELYLFEGALSEKSIRTLYEHSRP